MKLPWQPLDPDGDGILARVVHDAGTEHVAVFDAAGQARSVCDTMNRAAGVEAERSELAAEANRLLEENSALNTELAETRAKLARSLELWREWTRTDITATDDRWSEFTNRVHALLEEP